MSILEEIFAHKKQEVAEVRLHLRLEQLAEKASQMPPPIDFKAALLDSSRPTPRLIAEIKRKSPSKGVLRKDLDPLTLASIYADNGSAAISVLTDEKYFGGSLDDLKDVHALELGLPLLRKDFIFDSYQLLEARAAGASAVLLIVAMLDDTLLTNLISECHKLSLTPLVEVHDLSELDRALAANTQVIGINNRNLHNFTVSLENSLQLSKHCPPEIVLVAESGIHTLEDIEKLTESNIDAILVGEALVTTPDVAKKVRNLARVRVQ